MTDPTQNSDEAIIAAVRKAQIKRRWKFAIGWVLAVMAFHACYTFSHPATWSH